MQLVQLILQIEFDERNTLLHTPARKVFQALGGKVGKTQPTEPGAHILSESDKAEIRWNYDYCSIALEQIERHAESLKLIIDYLRTIDSVVPIGKLKVVELRTNWILPMTKYDFASLNRLYMQTVLSQKDYMQATFDTGVVLDMRIDDWIIHHESGPMNLKQLQEEYLHFRWGNLPQVFIFLLVSVKSINLLQYSVEQMGDFLTRGFDYCSRHSDNFYNIWRDYL